MKRLGVISHISKSGLLTVRASTPPRIGARVFLRGKEPVGTVIDVFGPVSSPYVSVKPTKRPANPPKNADVFVEERKFKKGRFYAKRS